MNIVKLRVDITNLGAPAPVPAPVGEQIPLVRSHAVASQDNPRTRTGVWECSPGQFRRQVTQAEFCHFLDGECSFTPDRGAPLEIRPGDALYFPPDTKGIWEIRKTTRKVFVVFDETPQSESI